jgi:hypothetical protein
MINKLKLNRQTLVQSALCAIPVLAALWVWFSSLSFVPVPWPDDSAFYFVAKDFFHWPPRWVMLPQAPFEPSYRIFNFNTMPLYPVIIGLGRFIGIDGSWAIKFWPLAAWAASGSLLVGFLYRAGLPALLCAVIAAAMGLDPTLRWASVLVRPESLIGLFGVWIVMDLSLGTWQKRKHDWIALFLAGAAYAHFNAVHLVYAVLFAWIRKPRQLIKTGLTTAAYLAPWGVLALLKWKLFIRQMSTQWTRLAVHNGWLDSPSSAINGIFQALGSPEPWPPVIQWAAVGIWLLIVSAVFFGLFLPLTQWAIRLLPHSDTDTATASVTDSAPPSLAPAAGWVIGAFWVWNSKPEVWFTYYLHLAVWVFAGIAMLKSWKHWQTNKNSLQELIPLVAVGYLVAAMTGIFGFVDVSQAQRLASTKTWKWPVYYHFIDCIDHQLVQLESQLGSPKPFRVWDPTFPDVTIELSRRHPDWEFTRTNDFWERNHLAIQHGREVQAVVVPETLGWSEREIDTPMREHPEVTSIWMTWNAYFLNQLWKEPGWKVNRHLCQTGRWQAFIFMEPLPVRGK